MFIGCYKKVINNLTLICEALTKKIENVVIYNYKIICEFL